MTLKEIKEKIRSKHERCYDLWIVRKDSEQNYCRNHKKHHKYWVYPTIEINPRPWWGFDSKKELEQFVLAEFA